MCVDGRIGECLQTIDGFKDEIVVEKAQEALVRVHEGFANRSEKTLKKVTTEQYFLALRKGMELYKRDKRGFYPGVALAAWDEPSKIIQCMPVFMEPKALRPWGTKAPFWQVTVRVTTRQVPLNSYNLPPIVPADHPSRGEWLGAISEDGRVYYFHTATGKTTWEEPAQYGVIGDTPADPMTAGAVRTLLDEKDEYERPIVRVVNYCVMEYAMGDEGKGWRLCGM